MPDKSLEVIPAAEAFALLKRDRMKGILALLDENLGGGFSVLNLPRIRVPTGGALDFRVEGASGETSARRITGILVASRRARIYWRKAYGGGGGKKPPDCTSMDGFVGIGDPGGECRICPYARFGSAIGANGKPGPGQACKDVRQVLFLLPGEVVPHLLAVPPTSVKAFIQYELNLINEDTKYWGAISTLTLEKATNEGGIDYARIAFHMHRPLHAEEQQVLEPYHLRMRDLLIPSVVDATAYEIVGEEAETSARPARPERDEAEPMADSDDEDNPDDSGDVPF
jgi:hypothetical protein